MLGRWSGINIASISALTRFLQGDYVGKSEYTSKHRDPDTLARKIVNGLPSHLLDGLGQQQRDALAVIGANMLIEFTPSKNVAMWIRDILEIAASGELGAW